MIYDLANSFNTARPTASATSHPPILSFLYLLPAALPTHAA